MVISEHEAIMLPDSLRKRAISREQDGSEGHDGKRTRRRRRRSKMTHYVWFADFYARKEVTHAVKRLELQN